MEFDKIQREVSFVAVRSRGPGGQNVNKVSSAAVLYWHYQDSHGLSEFEKKLVEIKIQNSINRENQIFVRSDEFRDLERNKNRCLEKLRTLLTIAFHKPKKRKPTRPTKASKLQKQVFKDRRSDTKKLRQKIR